MESSDIIFRERSAWRNRLKESSETESIVEVRGNHPCLHLSPGSQCQQFTWDRRALGMCNTPTQTCMYTTAKPSPYSIHYLQTICPDLPQTQSNFSEHRAHVFFKVMSSITAVTIESWYKMFLPLRCFKTFWLSEARPLWHEVGDPVTTSKVSPPPAAGGHVQDVHTRCLPSLQVICHRCFHKIDLFTGWSFTNRYNKSYEWFSDKTNIIINIVLLNITKHSLTKPFCKRSSPLRQKGPNNDS